jgi:hypothetical protein
MALRPGDKICRGSDWYRYSVQDSQNCQNAIRSMQNASVFDSAGIVVQGQSPPRFESMGRVQGVEVVKH